MALVVFDISMILKIVFSEYFQFLENTECWMKTGHSDWFLALPVLFTIVLNIYFLVRVIMILRQLGEQQNGILTIILTNLRSKLPDTGSPRPAPTRASIKQVLFNIYLCVFCRCTSMSTSQPGEKIISFSTFKTFSLDSLDIPDRGSQMG